MGSKNHSIKILIKIIFKNKFIKFINRFFINNINSILEIISLFFDILNLYGKIFNNYRYYFEFFFKKYKNLMLRKNNLFDILNINLNKFLI